ncbi:hypothetical protein JCM10212_005390 [Sporobolomyces blumeae]
MDSPNTSVYVPLSLTDTLSRPQRSFRSTHAASSSSSSSSSSSASSRPSTSRSYSSNSISSLGAATRARLEQAQRDAKSTNILAGLLDEGDETFEAGDGDVEATPRPDRTNHASFLPASGPTPTTASRLPIHAANASAHAATVAALQAKLDQRDQDVLQLKRELGHLARDKGELATECDRLRRAHAESEAKAARSGGLDAAQLQELEKQFSDQEALLGGYQREAEKSLAELDRLRTKERRLTDWFERSYGANWAEELGLNEKPGTLLNGQGAGAASLLNKYTSRPGLLTTPSSSSTLTTSSAPSLSSLNETSPSDPNSPTPAAPAHPDDATLSPSASTTATAALFPPVASHHLSSLSPQALKIHLDSVQALVRGMETRLIARNVELEAIGKRARTEARAADDKAKRLEALLEKFGLASPTTPVPV